MSVGIDATAQRTQRIGPPLRRYEVVVETTVALRYVVAADSLAEAVLAVEQTASGWSVNAKDAGQPDTNEDYRPDTAGHPPPPRALWAKEFGEPVGNILE
tara:strand:+ start:78 stop:377 length:300 start_codon:yes stop_codon:yes gene_type:complete